MNAKFPQKGGFFNFEYMASRAENVQFYNLGEYDCVFSCPPYHNLEIYPGMPHYASEEEWCRVFLQATLHQAFMYLKEGGHVALVLPRKYITACVLPLFNNTRYHELHYQFQAEQVYLEAYKGNKDEQSEKDECLVIHRKTSMRGR